MITLNCPTCGHELQIAPEYAGTTGKCMYCKARVSVPLQRAAIVAYPKVLQPLPTQVSSSAGFGRWFSVLLWAVFFVPLVAAFVFRQPAIGAYALFLCGLLIAIDARRSKRSLGFVVGFFFGAFFFGYVAVPTYAMYRKAERLSIGKFLKGAVAGFAVILVAVLVGGGLDAAINSAR